MDPWYDYLAMPVGLVLLTVQVAVVRWRGWPLAAVVSAAAVIAFLVMIAVVAGATTDQDANIGLALLAMEVVASTMLFLWAWLRHRGSSLG